MAAFKAKTSMKKSKGRDFKGRSFKKREDSAFPQMMRKRFCRFCRDKIKNIDYKNLNILERMISERGKILSVRNTSNCAKHQRKIAAAIKRARFLSLIPYTR